MNVYRKVLLVQLIMFSVFFVMGGYTIVEHFFRADYPWINFILLGLLLAAGVYGFQMYRKKDDRVCVITQKEVSLIRYLLYGYFLFYVLDIILPSVVPSIDRNLLAIVTGIILMGIAVYGIILQLRILKVK